MNKIRFISVLISVSLLFSGCGAKKKVRDTNTSTRTKKTEKVSEVDRKTSDTKAVIKSPTSKASMSTLEYIDEFADIAIDEMRNSNIPASITLAQAILESNSGKSFLTRNSNNHFGIKCHKTWEGERIYYDDDKKDECFRVYKHVSNSFKDHSEFLTGRERYKDLFKLNKGDYKAWARGLRKAGYATDKRYPQKLISIIEKYELYKYDEIVLEDNYSIDRSDQDVYIVKKGDGLYGISRRFGITIEELKSINGLESNTIYPDQELLLKPIENKVVKAVVNISTDTIPPKPVKVVEPKVEEVVTKEPPSSPAELGYHVVQEGETLYQIAYKYDLEIPAIRRWNNIRKNEVSIGQRVFIKDPKDVQFVNDGNTHIVVPEDTLYSISKKYGTTVTEIMQLNNMNDYTIFIGQVLKIKE